MAKAAFLRLDLELFLENNEVIQSASCGALNLLKSTCTRCCINLPLPLLTKVMLRLPVRARSAMTTRRASRVVDSPQNFRNLRQYGHTQLTVFRADDDEILSIVSDGVW